MGWSSDAPNVYPAEMIVVRALVPVSTALAAVSILLGMGLFLAAIVRVVVRRIAVQVPGAVLALSAGITAVIALGMTLLGKTLAETGTADQAPDLNSLILALWGVGESLWPVPAVLVVGAPSCGQRRSFAENGPCLGLSQSPAVGISGYRSSWFAITANDGSPGNCGRRARFGFLSAGSPRSSKAV